MEILLWPWCRQARELRTMGPQNKRQLLGRVSGCPRPGQAYHQAGHWISARDGAGPEGGESGPRPEAPHCVL